MTTPLAPVFWLAIASTLAFVGAIWQCVLAIVTAVESMEDFLGEHNRLVKEEKTRALARVPRWRLFRRRKAIRSVLEDAQLVLTGSEKKRSQAYDRQAWAWSWVINGALIAAIVSWVQVATS